MINKFRARSCPKCGYYLGFATAKRPAIAAQVAVTNFCLNCNYKLPMLSISRGTRRAPKAVKRGLLKLIAGGGSLHALRSESYRHNKSMSNTGGPIDYAHHLRIIGQDLENFHLDRFNLEWTGDAYLVWTRPDSAPANQNPLLRISRNRLQRLWKNRADARPIGHEESYTNAESQPAKRLRYSLVELERIERERRQLRRQRSGNADGHGLSQLLRTIGELVEQRGQRLLGISWQELSVSMVVETPQGRREIEVVRPDNLYDHWVRMYLKRDNRAISDTPR